MSHARGGAVKPNVSGGPEEPFRALREQHPKPVYAQRGSEWNVDQVEHGDDDREDARPGTEVQQSDSGDEAGQRKHQQNEEDKGADTAQEGNRNVGVAGVVGSADQAGDAAELEGFDTWPARWRLHSMTTVSNAELAGFFHDLNLRFDTVAELDSQIANRFNVFRWLSREVTLSSIIRELLDPSGTHGQGDVFLRSFLGMVGLDDQRDIDPKVRPTCEEPTRYATNPDRRIDIFLRLDSRFAIGIENKPLWAVDQTGWVTDYSAHLKQRADSYLLIYLTTEYRGPADSEIAAVDKLGSKFKNISYKEDIKSWLEACHRACGADRVRSFLKDFIGYVKVMKDTGMFSEQDLALVVNYVRDQPRDKGFRIAYLVKEAWPDVVRRIASDFQAALEERLRSKLDDEWEITRVPDSALLKPEGLGFRASKRQWQGRFAFSLCFAGSDCARAFFCIVKGGNRSHTYIPSLKAKMDEGMRAARQNRYWEWWSYVDTQYQDWNTPETLVKLKEKDQALHYLAGLFEKMRQIAEPLIDAECAAS